MRGKENGWWSLSAAVFPFCLQSHYFAPLQIFFQLILLLTRRVDERQPPASAGGMLETTCPRQIIL